MYRYRKSVKSYAKDGGRPICVFCDSEHNILLQETELSYVMRSNFAYDVWEFREVTDHLLVIPRRHVQSLLELTPQEQADVMRLSAEYESKQYNIYARAVNSVTRTVPMHQHTHLIKTTNKEAKAALYLKKPYFLHKV